MCCIAFNTTESFCAKSEHSIYRSVHSHAENVHGSHAKEKKRHSN